MMIEPAWTGLSSPYELAINGNELYITENSSNGALVKFDLCTLSLNDLTLDSKKLHVIANPSTEHITISGLKNKERFGIYNLLGAEMLTGALMDNDEIEIKRFSNGLYFLKFNDGATLKFIKE